MITKYYRDEYEIDNRDSRTTELHIRDTEPRTVEVDPQELAINALENAYAPNWAIALVRLAFWSVRRR